MTASLYILEISEDQSDKNAKVIISVPGVMTRSRIFSDSIALSTRTDLGTKWMYDLASEGDWHYTYRTSNGTYEWDSLCCVLITDGDPYGEVIIVITCRMKQTVIGNIRRPE